MTTFFLIHGYRVSDTGDGTVDRLINPLEAKGHDIIDFDYGHKNLLQAKFSNQEVAEKLANLVAVEAARGKVVLVGHSNGNAVIDRALQILLPHDNIKVVYINPALKREKLANAAKVGGIVYYSPSDKATLTAGIVRRVPLLRRLLPSGWGMVGTFGPRDYPGIIGVNEEELVGAEIGHSDIFAYADVLAEDILSRV